MSNENTTTLPQMKVSPNTLKVDYSYQRPLDKNRVNYIVQQFKPSLLRFPICSIRNEGGIYIIDGNHTVNAVKALGWKEIPIFYHEGLTVEQEAIEFYDLNKGGKDGRLPVSVAGRFKSRLRGGLPVEVKISQIVNKLGLNLHGNGKNGISAFEAVYWTNSNGNLEKTLYTLKAWCPESRKVYENDLIRSVSAFYQKYPNADPNRLAKALSKFQPLDISSLFMRAKRSHPKGSYAGQIMELRDLYNSGVRGQNKLLG